MGKHKTTYRATDQKTAAFRIVLALMAIVVLIFLCCQHNTAGIKGTSFDAWRLIPLLLVSTCAAGLGKRFLNWPSGLFLGGIGGGFGTLDPVNGPYGVILGLVVGTVVILLPVLNKPVPRLACGRLVSRYLFLCR